MSSSMRSASSDVASRPSSSRVAPRRSRGSTVSTYPAISACCPGSLPVPDIPVTSTRATAFTVVTGDPVTARPRQERLRSQRAYPSPVEPVRDAIRGGHQRCAGQAGRLGADAGGGRRPPPGVAAVVRRRARPGRRHAGGARARDRARRLDVRARALGKADDRSGRSTAASGGRTRPSTCTSSHPERVSPSGTGCSATGCAPTPRIGTGMRR
jgi:hypothetical protein